MSKLKQHPPHDRTRAVERAAGIPGTANRQARPGQPARWLVV